MVFVKSAATYPLQLWYQEITLPNHEKVPYAFSQYIAFLQLYQQKFSIIVHACVLLR